MVIKDISAIGYIFSVKGGEVVKALNFALPEGTTRTKYDVETRILTCFFDDDQEPVEMEIEQSTIDAAAVLEDISQAKADKLESLKRIRDRRLKEGFEYGGKHFQTRNSMDIMNVSGVGQAALANPGFSTFFRASDNSYLALDSATGQALFGAMVGQGQAIWAEYQSKEALVLAASTVEEVEAV